MEDKSNNENQQSQSNDSLKGVSSDNSTPSKATEDTSKINLEQNSNSSKDNKENKELNNSNNSNLNERREMKQKIIKLNEKKVKEKSEKKARGDKDKSNEKFLEEKELIKEIKKDNYRKLYIKRKFCDYRASDTDEWKVGLVNDILEDSMSIEDMKDNKKYQIKIEDSSRLSYFRKYSKPSENNLYSSREKKDSLANKLSNLEKIIKGDNIFNCDDISLVYYSLHSKIYFALDAAMKVNEIPNYTFIYSSSSNNEGGEESFRIILYILLFISKYFKYLLDNKDEFINYQNNINNIEFSDLKIVNKKYAFFSFFEESFVLLSKIFANNQNYLDWFITFEKDIKKIILTIEKENKQNSDFYYPLYEEEEEDDEKDEDSKMSEKNKSDDDEKDKNEIYEKGNEITKNKLLLKRICLDIAYKLETTFTSDDKKIKAVILAYFIDYFNAINGFSYLFQLCYCSKAINLNFLLTILNNFSNAKAMTSNYKKTCKEEKKQLLNFICNYIDNLDEKIILENKNNKILTLINKISMLLSSKKEESQKIYENLFLHYTIKTLLLSKKLEQKISSLNTINDTLKAIKHNADIGEGNLKMHIKKTAFEDFCINCRKQKVLQILLNDKSIHEEIIKRLTDIIFIMYEYNFGYSEKDDKNTIKSDKKMIFEVLFNKLLESEQSNEKSAKNIQNIICDFSEILSEEDKLYVYNEIEQYLEKSIEKKGIPTKDHLSFIIDYSLKAIDSKKKKNNKDKEEKPKVIKKEETQEIENSDNKSKENEDNKDDDKDKLVNLKFEEQDYYGLKFLLKYLSQEQYKQFRMTNEQKIELINLSIEGIIKIIENCEQNDLLLKHILLKIISEINDSKDVIQYLMLFKKLKEHKNKIPMFTEVLDDYSKKYDLLSIFICDMNRYLSLINLNNEEMKEKDKINKEEKKIYEGLFDNKSNIKIRLGLIFVLLQKNINDEYLNNFNKKIISPCNKNIYANECLNKFILDNLNKIDFKFIQFFYDNILLSKEKTSNMDDLQYYKICNLIIKEINKANKIFYFMNNKDLAVINCESEKDIKGIDLLWNFLMKTKNNLIRNEVIDFLADIFFGIRIEQEKMNNYWMNFIKSIYDKLDELIKVENQNKGNGDSEDSLTNGISIQGIISLIKKIENKFADKGEIIANVDRILEEINLNKVEQTNKLKEKDENINLEKTKLISFYGNIYNTEKILNYDSNIDSTEYFYMFRYKLSSYFKIPINLVSVVVEERNYNGQQINLNNNQFDLFNDFDNTYSILDNIEQKIKKNNNKANNINQLILRVEVKKDSEKLKYIKKAIKDFPKLLELMKSKDNEYLLDIWCLIKEDNLKISPNIVKIIKEILNEDNPEKLNTVFNFENTNIYYISYVLFHLIDIINELNKTNDKFIEDIFMKSRIWNEKIKNINLKDIPKSHLVQIYEKNKIINYLLNIFKIVSQKTEDKNILLFILNRIFEYYYDTINECISINLEALPSTNDIRIDTIEDLYILNTTKIKEIIIQNQFIYNSFIKILLTKEEKSKIKSQFEFLFTKGLLKNRIYSLNLKLQSFLMAITDDKFFNLSSTEKDTIIISDYYIYLLDIFLSPKIYKKIINDIKDLIHDKSKDIYFNIDKYENNIKLYFDFIIDIINKVYPTVYNKFNFKSYINEISLEQIYNPIIEGISLELSFHQIIFGGQCKILLNLLTKLDNYKELLNIKESKGKKLQDYLFNEIIMNKCNENIFTEENIDNYKSLSISLEYAFKPAVNLFIFLVMQNIQNSNEDEVNIYFDKLTELHKKCFWKGNSFSDWKLEYKDNNKMTPFVGLKNLGCTCYMNSLLQVFYNYIPFRNSLLKCKCKEEKKNALYQIKKVFYALKYLQVNYYTPVDFPNNFDDEVLDIHSQMDVDEFFGNILDKIENRLKNTNNENLVKYFFQGRQNDLLTFQEGCTHHRINVNNFYSIQLQIKNKKNIYESLDTLIEGELMNGDNCIFCPTCNKKFPAVKSQNFKTLPRMLIFVLKRFEFDYNTMKKVKINDYYEFPQELDMTKYISENKDDVNLNKYLLKSVVVHMGSCEGGHYYAFIKNKDELWYEFNDTQVTPFDINYLKEEAYGGEEIYFSNGNKHINEKNRSAYLLFYEKKIQTDCEHFDHIESINSLLGNANTEEENIINNENENIINTKELETKENKNENNKIENEYGINDILKTLNKEMFKYSLNKKFFSNEYQYFILELYLNILNYYYSYDLPIFLMHLCRTPNNKEFILREVQSMTSNLNLYIDKGKLVLFPKKIKPKDNLKQNSEKILEIFKHFIIYFYNVFLRTKEKEYLGGMVDLIKFFINDQPNCANYIIEEFCNTNVIIEYLINCPLYEIKKIIVGILYCAMIKSVNEYETLIKKEENDKKKNKLNNNLINNRKEDEENNKQLYDNADESHNFIYDNPLEYENIPKNILKMIYNILHLIRDNRYNHMNEYRFLYFTIYRFSLISQNTRRFLIFKCRLFELLCLLLHNNLATYAYEIKKIISSTYVGPYTVKHDILNTKGKKEENICVDKGGMYRVENYIYMLFFYLLSYTYKNSDIDLIREDSGYLLDNKDFVRVLLNNIRTKQDAFCFSDYINEKCRNNKNATISVFESLVEYLNKVDNNENKNYDYNNYNNFVDNMNETPNDNDPGMNPKYLLIILKRFISSLNIKADFVQKNIRNIFKVFWNNQNFYNYCIMVSDFIIDLFSTVLKGVIPAFKKELEQLKEWYQKWPIAPTLYQIDGLSLYKFERKNYDTNIPEEKINEFNDKELKNTGKKIEIIIDVIKNEPINKIRKLDEDMDLFDFKFIIGDVITYNGKDAVIEEVLDELLKITIEINKKNGKKGIIADRKEIWIESDNPKIEIKELKGKQII